MADPSHPKVAQPDHDILDVVRRRWSPRAFDASRSVPESELRRLFEAARWAPSSRNEQPWRFVVFDRERHAEAFAGLLTALTPRNHAWAEKAPVLVLVAVRLTHEIDDALNAAAWYDTGQAVGFLSLQATELNLSIRQMLGFSAEHVRQACLVPRPFEPAIIIAIGYAGEAQSLATEQLREAELKPRARRPLSEFVFDGEWGKGVD